MILKERNLLHVRNQNTIESKKVKKTKKKQGCQKVTRLGEDAKIQNNGVVQGVTAPLPHMQALMKKMVFLHQPYDL